MALSVRLVDAAFGGGDLVVSTDGVDANERLVAFVDTDAGGGPPAPAGWASPTEADANSGSDTTWSLVRASLGPGASTHTFSIGGGADGAVILLAVAASSGTPEFDFEDEDAAAATGVGPGQTASMAAPSVNAAAGTSQLQLCHWMLYNGTSGVTIGSVPDGMTSVVSNLQSNGWGRRTVAWQLVSEGASGTKTVNATSSSPGHVSTSVAFFEEGGQLEEIDAVGALVAPAAAVSGAGSVEVTGTGALTAAAAVTAGTGSVVVTASGAVVAPAAMVSGAGGQLGTLVDVTVTVAAVRSRAQVTTGVTRQGWAVGPIRRERGPASG